MGVSHASIARSILPGAAEGPVIASEEALSFWGGVDPATGRVIDVRHPLRGVCVTAGVVPASFGNPAERLTDAYVCMGCRPTFTCSPYLLDSASNYGVVFTLST